MQPTPPGQGEFARLLAEIQQDTGLSYKQVATAAGVHRSQVWRWVNAGSSPGYEPVRRLAGWLAGRYPHLADDAARLLPAAGYEAPAATVAAGVATAAGAAAVTAAAQSLIGQRLAATVFEVADGVRAQISRARDCGKPENRIFRDPSEQALWSMSAIPEDQRVMNIAYLRAMRPGSSDPAALAS